MHLDACTACRGGGPETCKASFKEWVPWNLTRGTLKVPGSDFKVLPGEGSLSGELTDFVPGVLLEVAVGKERRKGFAGKSYHFPYIWPGSLTGLEHQGRQHMRGRWKGA